MGGIAAAIRSAGDGMHVCVTEETSWIGGQMTSQGVSALDENYLVETSGSTRLYQRLRELIRRRYKSQPGISERAAADEQLNPGSCWVSRISFEPSVGLAALNELISENAPSRNLRIATRQKVVHLKVENGRVRSALAVDLDTGKFTEYRARYFLDATELGDLLPLSGVPYSSGAESRSQTGEPHAPETANFDNVQDFTYPFVLECSPDKRGAITQPPYYQRFLDEGKFSFAGYKMFGTAKAPERQSEHQAFYTDRYLPFWTYRRLVATDNFPNSSTKDLTMINWVSNDLRGENIIDKPPEVQAQRLALAKNLSLGFLHWLQTQAPRDEGGQGYPEFQLRADVLDTADGLSKYPYIRESRRIKAQRTITEQDIACASNNTARARLFGDSVGIGFYPIDIHGHQDVPGAQQASLPFQIPLSAMVQDKVRNLIPSCKNIGTTHVTNGAYRLHAVEWAIGEAAGTLAAFCVHHRTSPEKVLHNRVQLVSLQTRLVAGGAPIYWFDDVPTTGPNFAAIQMLSVSEVMPSRADNLSFDPDALISLDEQQQVIGKIKLSTGGKTPKIAEGTTRSEFAAEVYSSIAHHHSQALRRRSSRLASSAL